MYKEGDKASFNPLNGVLNPIRHLLALVGARRIVHVSRIRVKALCLDSSWCLRKIMSNVSQESQFGTSEYKSGTPQTS